MDESLKNSTLFLQDSYFHTIDFTVLILMLTGLAASGFYFGFFREKIVKQKPSIVPQHDRCEDGINFGQKQLNDFLLGSKELKPFPVAMSLVASYVSGITILGVPSEIYNYGTQFCLILIPILLSGLTVAYVFLPVYDALQLGSSYEYLEMRFNNRIRTFISVLFVVDVLLFLPVVIYVPSIAFNQVTGFNVYAIATIIGLVSLFYTISGGLRAVVFTDSWQIIIMFISIFCIGIIGTFAAGGPSEIYRVAMAGDRIKLFDIDTSLYKRHSFQAVLFGGYSYWISVTSINQAMVQRYMSLPDLKTAKISILIFSISIGLFMVFCCYLGLLIYVLFASCDPKSAELIKTSDQLLPLYVMQTVGNIWGMPGLFIAAIFGAALSSISIFLNSSSAILYEDVLKGALKIKLSERNSFIFVKCCILLIAVYSISAVFIVEELGGILELVISLSTIFASTSFGLFFLGMLVPWSNTKGATIGAIFGSLITGWLSIGTKIMIASNRLASQKLVISTEGCPVEYQNLTSVETIVDESDVFPLYRLSFHWISPIGILTVIVLGTIVSLITGGNDLKKLDPRLISPVIHRFLPKECFRRHKINKVQEEHEPLKTKDNNFNINK